MDVNKIKELISAVKEAGIESINYENNGIKLEIKNSIDKENNLVVENNNLDNDVKQVEKKEVKVVKEEVIEDDFEKVISPLVGVYYEAPGPEMDAFVKEGQKVKKGDVLCIVEAMKVMNEIVAKKDCTIKKILVNNEDIVEHNQALFLIE